MKPLAYTMLIALAALIAGSLAYAAYPLAEDDAVLASGISVLPGVASVGRLSGYVVVEGVVEQRGFLEVDGRRYPVILVRGDDGSVYRAVLGARALDELPGDAGAIVLVDVMMEHRVRITGIAVNGGELVIVHSIEMMCSGHWMGMDEAMAGRCMTRGMPGPMGGMHDMPGHGGPGD